MDKTYDQMDEQEKRHSDAEYWAGAEMDEQEKRRDDDEYYGLIQYTLDQYEEKYNEGEEPIYVWCAIKLLDKKGIPLPSWVADNLVEVATILTSLDREGAHFKDKVVEAFGVKQRSISKHIKEERDEKIYDNISMLHTLGPLELGYKYMAKKLNLSPETVKRIYTKKRSQYNKEKQ